VSEPEAVLESEPGFFWSETVKPEPVENKTGYETLVLATCLFEETEIGIAIVWRHADMLDWRARLLII